MRRKMKVRVMEGSGGEGKEAPRKINKGGEVLLPPPFSSSSFSSFSLLFLLLLRPPFPPPLTITLAWHTRLSHATSLTTLRVSCGSKSATKLRVAAAAAASFSCSFSPSYISMSAFILIRLFACSYIVLSLFRSSFTLCIFVFSCFLLFWRRRKYFEACFIFHNFWHMESALSHSKNVLLHSLLPPNIVTLAQPPPHGSLPSVIKPVP